MAAAWILLFAIISIIAALLGVVYGVKVFAISILVATLGFMLLLGLLYIMMLAGDE